MLSLIPLLSSWVFLAQEPDQLDQRLELLSERIEEARIAGHVPSLGFALVNRDGVIWSGGFGSADLETGEPATDRTLYAIGSTTKAFTSTLVGDLVDEGRIEWDALATEVAPGWTLAARDGEAITLRDLLSHRTGYPRMSLLFASGKARPTRIMEVSANAKPLAGYHEAFLYNNVQYLAAGLAAAEAGGASWETLVEARLLDPLGMYSTTTSTARAGSDARLATGYHWDAEESKHDVLPLRDISNIGPAGSIYSNARDMSRWLQFQLNRGAWQGEQLVSVESIEECWQPNIEIAPGVDYGMGWMLHETHGQRMVEHGGNIDGYSAAVGLLPDSGYGFVMLCNLNGASIQGQINSIVWSTLLDPLPSEDEAAGAGEELDRFLGEYRSHIPNIEGAVTALVQDGKLAVDVPGQMAFALKAPDEEGKRAFEITDAIKVSFLEDDNGSVTAMVLHQGGLDLEFPREGVEIAPEIPLAALEPLLGNYHFEPADMEWKMLIQNNRLAVDVPGEMVYELRAPDADGWRAFRATDALKLRFRFDDAGAPEGMDYVMRGQEFFLPRTSEVKEVPTTQAVLAALQPQARGERFAAWQGVTMEFDALVEQAGVTGKVIWSSTADHRLVSSLDMGDFGSAKTVVLPDSGWTDSDFEPFDPLNARERAEIRDSTGVRLAIADFTQCYQSIEFEGLKSWQDREHWVLAGKNENRPTTRLWFDTASGDLRRIDLQLDITDGGTYMPIRVTLSDYRVVQGVRVPHRIVTENQASGRMILEVAAVRPGDAPSAAAFEAPKQ